MLDKGLKAIDELNELLYDVQLPQEHRASYVRLLKEVRKGQVKSDFALKRLRLDKEITEGFLNETIKDLEATTEQLRAYQEKELAEKDRTILYKETQLQQVLDAAPNLISLVDREFRYLITNELYTGFFGHHRDDLTDAHIEEVISKDTFQQIKPFLENAFNGEYQEFEQPVKDQNGSNRILRISISPATDLEGKNVGAYLFGQDITDLKEIEAAINSKNIELQKYIQSNLQLENFAYLASHDLQSPVANVINFADALTESAHDKLDVTERQFLHYINTSSKRMQQFINDLLNYALATNRTIDAKTIDPREILDHVIEDLSTQVKESNANISIGKFPKSIEADETILSQIFQNLLSNALKFAHADRPPVIHVDYKMLPKQHVFSVSDNGIGIPEEYHGSIFGIFKKLHLYSEYPGTGIGLSTVKEAVEKHNGRIWIESQEGEGATFIFTVPEFM